MFDPVEPLILDLLEWIGPQSRPYADVLEAWHTSCPRLPVWEEANSRGFVEHRHEVGHPPVVTVTALGLAHLEARRARTATASMSAQPPNPALQPPATAGQAAAARV